MSLLLLALALSLDAFAAALSQGAAVRSGSTARTALIVALAFGIAQGLMPLLGWSLGQAFAPVLRDVDHWVAFVLLVLIGGHMLGQGFSVRDRADTTVAPVAGGTALLMVAFATSIDAAVAGATFVGLRQAVAVSCVVIGVTTFLLSGLGVFLGKAASVAIGPRAQVFGGLVLIALAIKIVIEHVYFGA